MKEKILKRVGISLIFIGIIGLMLINIKLMGFVVSTGLGISSDDLESEIQNIIEISIIEIESLISAVT